MAKNKMTILLVDDNSHVLEMLEDIFADYYHTIAVLSGSEAVEKVKSNSSISTVVLDIKMAGMDGIETARKIKNINPDLPIILNTGYPGEYGEDRIEKEIKPFDYNIKGDTVTPLIRSVRNGVESYSLRLFRKGIESQLQNNFGMIGKSIEMKKVFRMIQKVAPTDNKVMILGETGTGKELVARAMHNFGRRSDKKLGIVNCNHKTTELVEAELFGYKKGAFTGALTDRKGLFEMMNGGTVFLDEIGDLSARTQIALLRVLETGEFAPLGPEAEMKNTDVRLVCATHRDLAELVNKGEFRQDLYYRLKGIIIKLPPLRERKEDIPLLVEKFNDDYAQKLGGAPKMLDQSAINALIDYSWPGNVRELCDTVESLCAITDSDIIFGSDVYNYLNMDSGSSTDEGKSLTQLLREYEKGLIIKTLAESENNISLAARMLKIDPANLRRKIKLHNINISD